jgi:hypothetical protein
MGWVVEEQCGVKGKLGATFSLSAPWRAQGSGCESYNLLEI